MTTVTNINDVVDGHVSLKVDWVDRLYLNAYVPKLQVAGQVARFLHDHLGKPVPLDGAGRADRQPVPREVHLSLSGKTSRFCG